MRIACTGPARRLEELKIKISSAKEIQIAEFSTFMEMSLTDADIYIDAGFDLQPFNSAIYPDFNAPVLLSSCRITLMEFCQKHQWTPAFPIMGFCATPTFINRSLWELTDPFNQFSSFESFFSASGVSPKIVADFPGMTGPRVVSMIINEAWLTFQEGTATKEDIDIAMKLGTNYPLGPFEWGEQMGLEEVVAILDSLRNQTGDPRYQVSRWLREASYSTPS